MFLPTRPSPAEIERFIDRSRDLPLSYGPVGIVNDARSGAQFDETVVAIGRGARDFARARAALESWAQFDIGWVELFPRLAPTASGTVVAVLIRHLGFWSLNGCRVVYTVGDRDRDRFGYAYGTLPNHAEAGEELFEVYVERSGNVMCRIRATSTPRALLARVGHPIARALMARFRRDSTAAMKRAIIAGGDDLSQR